MSWESDFTYQWQKFLDIIESNVCREFKSNGNINYMTINNLVQRESSKWFNSNHYNGAWLSNLSQELPYLAEEFRSTLEDLQVSRKISFNPGLPILPISAVAGLMIITFFVLGQLEDSLVKQFSGSVVAALIGFPILKDLQDKKNHNNLEQLIKEIHRELEYTGKRLKSIAIKADLESQSIH